MEGPSICSWSSRSRHWWHFHTHTVGPLPPMYVVWSRCLSLLFADPGVNGQMCYPHQIQTSLLAIDTMGTNSICQKLQSNIQLLLESNVQFEDERIWPHLCLFFIPLWFGLRYKNPSHDIHHKETKRTGKGKDGLSHSHTPVYCT